MKKWIFSIALLGILAAAFFFRVSLKEFVFSFAKQELPEPKLVSEFMLPPAPTLKPPRVSQKSKQAKPSPAPTQINLNIPFGSQAPFADWGMPYQEACEEAAVIMAHRFFSGEPLDAEIMNTEILKLVEWQEKTFGYYKDTTAEEIARILREYFGHADIEVRYKFTIDDIKKEVAAGHPVIVPAAGRLLPNPNFKQPGPIYHALVVKGFLANGKIITNDPGTRKGADFLYNPAALMNAVHDWNAEDILKGKKVMIVVRS